MDEQLIKNSLHQRFIRMLIDEKNDMNPNEASNKNSMYKNSIQ
jgi:hypothetical protein